VHAAFQLAGGFGLSIERPGLTREEFVGLVERYNDDLIRLAFAMSGDRAAAEDAAQACWQAAWKARHAIRDLDGIRGCLFTVTANQMRRYLRRKRLGDLLQGRTSARVVTPVDARHLDLHRAVTGLTLAERQLVGLRYGMGLTSEEIGQILGLSASGTRRRLQRVLAKLRLELDDV
jgi:RNA polymerase sigma-70 factor (ECF subfamily)